MKRITGFIVSALLLTGLLAGCAKSPEEAGNISTPENHVSDTETGNEEIHKDGSAEWPRTYTDALGREIVLEEKPERTAMLFFRNYEHLFVLDELPVAGTEVQSVYKGWEMFKPYAEKHEVIDLGNMDEENLEKLLEVAPDLIIAYTGTYEKIGEQLEKIATTITVDNYGDDWQAPLTEYGKIFGKEDMAQAEIDKLKDQLQSGVKELSDYSDKTFAFLRFDGTKGFLVYVLDFVYNEEAGLGLKAPEGYLDQGRTTISLEGVSEFNPDYIFIYDNAGDDGEELNLEELNSSSSVWNSLEAVKNEHVYLIDRSAFSGGPMSISYGVDAILESLNLK